MLCSFRCRYLHPLVRSLSTTCSMNRLRSEWRVDRPPANTKLANEEIVEKRKAFGGRSKMKAIQVNSGNYTLMSKSFTKNMKIVDVVHSDAGQHYRESKILAKGTIVTVELSFLKGEIDSWDLLLGEEQHIINGNEMENHIKDLLEKGQAYAKITSRPGQIGCCDGHILEGNELVATMNKIKMKYGYNF